MASHRTAGLFLEHDFGLEFLYEGYVVGRLTFTQDVVGLELEPGLGTPGPDMSHGRHPAGVVDRARTQTQDPVGWRLAMGDPTTAITAECPIALVARIGFPFRFFWRPGGEFEGAFSDRRGEPECAARDSLAIGTVTGIDHQRRRNDPVSQAATLAAPFDRKSYFSCHVDRFPIEASPLPLAATGTQ